ncbi:MULTISPECIES: hypothetical protein [Acinetobacter]|uniref:hypothetical protein n=1 Tax=Acinetobacter TaxID=469 RepID=UPI0014449C21|nr:MULTISPECIES: hypothetical protein [Acinetobacter]
MTNKVIELSVDELKKLDDVLEIYANQQREQRKKFGECEEDKTGDQSFFELRKKVKSALKSSDPEYNIFFV